MKQRALIDHAGSFVLGYSFAGFVWVLCRNGEYYAGPAYCDSLDDAVELRVLLAARAEYLGQVDNKRLVDTLSVFLVHRDICDAWSPETPLWIKCQPEDLEEVSETQQLSRNERARLSRRRAKSSTVSGVTKTTPASDNISYVSFPENRNQ